MQRKRNIALVLSEPRRLAELRKALGEGYACTVLSPADFAAKDHEGTIGFVIDADLASESVVGDIRRGLSKVDRGAAFVLMVLPSGKPTARAQARVLGCEEVIERDDTLDDLAGDGGSFIQAAIDVAKAEFAAAASLRIETLSDRFALRAAAPAGLRAGVDAGSHLLQSVFEIGAAGAPLDQRALAGESASVIDSLAEHGLAAWVDMVRGYHNATYQHCLLVAGTTIAFGQKLGFRNADLKRVAVAALLHDVGKAKIPIDILEKPGALDPAELAVMRKHPRLGREILEAAGGFDAEMLDVVEHHHEFLDGTGYPDGLAGDAIHDIVRFITIADIFGALIERRSYKPPMPNRKALEIITSMKGKLDPSLVRAFEPVALQFGMAA